MLGALTAWTILCEVAGQAGAADGLVPFGFATPTRGCATSMTLLGATLKATRY